MLLASCDVPAEITADKGPSAAQARWGFAHLDQTPTRTELTAAARRSGTTLPPPDSRILNDWELRGLLPGDTLARINWERGDHDVGQEFSASR